MPQAGRSRARGGRAGDAPLSRTHTRPRPPSTIGTPRRSANTAGSTTAGALRAAVKLQRAAAMAHTRRPHHPPMPVQIRVGACVRPRASPLAALPRVLANATAYTFCWSVSCRPLRAGCISSKTVCGLTRRDAGAAAVVRGPDGRTRNAAEADSKITNLRRSWYDRPLRSASVCLGACVEYGAGACAHAEPHRDRWNARGTEVDLRRDVAGGGSGRRRTRMQECGIGASQTEGPAFGSSLCAVSRRRAL